jgi:hypothetical protein
MLHEEITEIGDCAVRGCKSFAKVLFPTLSSRLGGIAFHWRELNNKVDEIRVNVENGSAVRRSMRGAIQRRIHELVVPVAAIEDIPSWHDLWDASYSRNWKNIRKVLCKIGRLISYYEMKEATTIYELALWKSKLR